MSDRFQENRTLWVGNVDAWMDETYLLGVFSPVGIVKNVKIVRTTRMSMGGYAFVEFESRADAAKIYDQLNGEKLIAPDGHRFPLNWAMYGLGHQRGEAGDVSIYVGNLETLVRDQQLYNLFANKYKTVQAAKVICEHPSGNSKGFGFVRFKDADEADKSLVEMQGVYLKGRPIKVRPATKNFNETHTIKDPVRFAEVICSVPPPPEPENLYKVPPPPPPCNPTGAVELHLGVPPPQPAITNMTTAKAHLQAWQQVGEAQATQVFKADASHPEGSSTQPALEVPSLEHFQALLHHPYFVQAFEQELASGAGGSGSSVYFGAPRLSRLLADRPEEFSRPPSVDRLNEEFISGLSSTGGLGSRAVPALPEDLRVTV